MSDLSHDSEGAPPVQLPPRLLDLWEAEIVPQLPRRLDEQARSLGAYQRYREIERASDLLRALLAWVLGGCSCAPVGMLGGAARSSRYLGSCLAPAVCASAGNGSTFY
jgi:hypothetical protein